MNFGLADYWWWLIGAAVLGILEVVFPGVFLIWMAAAAAITGLVAAVLPIALPFQIALFGLLAMAAVYGGRRHYDRNPVLSSDPHLNDRTARLIGQRVTVTQAIRHGEGRVQVGDGVWSARGPDCDEGSLVMIVGAEGACLRVVAAPAPQPVADGASGASMV